MFTWLKNLFIQSERLAYLEKENANLSKLLESAKGEVESLRKELKTELSFHRRREETWLNHKLMVKGEKPLPVSKTEPKQPPKEHQAPLFITDNQRKKMLESWNQLPEEIQSGYEDFNAYFNDMQTLYPDFLEQIS